MVRTMEDCREKPLDVGDHLGWSRSRPAIAFHQPRKNKDARSPGVGAEVGQRPSRWRRCRQWPVGDGGL